MAHVIQRRSTRRQLIEAFDYLEERGGIEVARRFLDAASKTFQELAETPHMGPLCGFERPSLRRLRRWRIEGFENWLIFYQPKRTGVEIVHVIHGARDIETLLGEGG